LIAEAAWNIIENEGIEKVSIRRVAAEAGMSPGALRHYFSTKDEMLLFIIEYFIEEGKKRSDQKNWSKNPLQAVEEVLLEVALIERLSFHALIRPDIYTPEKVKEVINYHLKTLCNK